MAGILKTIEEELLAIALYESFVRQRTSRTPPPSGADDEPFYDFQFKNFHSWHRLSKNARLYWRKKLYSNA